MRNDVVLPIAIALALGAAWSCGDDDSATASSAGGSAATAQGGSTNTTSSAGGSASGGSGGAGGGGQVVTDCDSVTCHFVLEGAAGDGSGNDWTNALPELPAALVRGHVYFVGTGNYPGYSFDDGESGSDVIRVLRATASDHGTDLGWDVSYGEIGGVDFGPISVESDDYELDGRNAMRAVGDFQSTVVDIGASNVVFRGWEVDGNFKMANGQHSDGACTGMSVNGNDVIVADSHIHDAADDGVAMGGANITFSGNVVHALHACGTDGGCGPCYNGHSDGLELYHLTDSAIVGNLIYDVRSTSAVFFGNWADELGNGPADYCSNVLLANNLLYSPDTGFVAYIEDAVGVQLYQNVVWGLRQGAYGGLSIGQNVSDLDLYNNVILSINYTHIGGTYNATEHRGDYNLFGASLGQWQDQTHDLVAIDPGFTVIPDGNGAQLPNPVPSDFTPASGSPLIDAGYLGDANIVLPTTDFFGIAPGPARNIGAIE